MCSRFHSRVHARPPSPPSRGAWTFPHVREEKTKSSKCEKKETRVWRERNEEEKSGCYGESRILVPAFHHRFTRRTTMTPSSPFHSVSPASEFISSEIPSGLNSARRSQRADCLALAIRYISD